MQYKNRPEYLQGTNAQHNDNIDRNRGTNTESQQHKPFKNANINTETNFATKNSRPQRLQQKKGADHNVYDKKA